MNTEQMRFEAWAKSEGYSVIKNGPGSTHVVDADAYYYSDTRQAWVGWQAAMRQAEKDSVGLLNLLADIRAAAGDPQGKLMQDELVAHIAATHQAVPDGFFLAPNKATQAMLRPFYECPPDELELAYEAMRIISGILVAAAQKEGSGE